MKRISNKFTAAILLFWLSMCIWKICSLTGQTNILCMVAVSLLDIIGLIIIIGNLYQLEEWNYGEWWLYHSNRIIVIGLMMWIVILCVQIGSAASLSLSYWYFSNVSMVSYASLQVCYLLNGILTMAISILYTAVLIKTSAKTEYIRIIRYIQQQRWFCSSYVAGVILCQLISAILLNTGEHKSTPVSNLILNLLYFGMLSYLLISLCIFWKKTQILLSAANSDADISDEAGRKPHCHRRIWGFALMCTVISGYGAIANYSTEIDFEYREPYREEGIVLRKYTGQRSYVKIPKQINGRQVVGLEASFYGCDFIKGVFIPQGVESVGYNTFNGCGRMTAISLPDSIKTIGEKAFESCIKLKKIMIPDSVEEIGDYTFLGCEDLEKVKLPSNLKVIRQGTFAQCNSLKQLMIPESVTEIRRYAFGHCKSLTELTIPDGVSNIEEDTFSGCSGLRQVVLPEGIKKIGRKAFQGCTALEEMELPEGLTVILEEAFYGCSELSHVTLPQSLKWIEEDAFTKCISLKTIQIHQDINYIASDAFRDCDNLESTIPKTSFVDREEVIVPDGVTVIGEDTFRNCSRLKYVYLPEGLKWIGKGAFAGCTSLEEIVIPKRVEKIESKTFYRCSKLKTIEMPGVYQIEKDSFEGCVNLQNITISSFAIFTLQDIIGQKPDEPDEMVIENKTESAVSLLKRAPYIRPSQLSADLLSGQISIGDKIYQFPMHYEDFAAYGLMIEADTEEVLAPGEYRFVDVGEGENEFAIVVENIDRYNRPLKVCYVTSVVVYPNNIVNLEIVLPGGLKLQDCSKEEIEGRYGKPQEIFDDSPQICILTYTVDYNMVARFRFKDMSLTTVSLDTTAAGNINCAAALFAEPLRIDGEAYHFPMTYEAFTALGWQNDNSEEEMVKARQSIDGDFTMGENKCQVLIENYEWRDTPVQSCSITGIQILSSQCKDMEVRLPGGFEVMQCSQETIKVAYGPPNDGFGTNGKIDSISYYDNAVKMSANFCFFSDNKKLKLFRIETVNMGYSEWIVDVARHPL